MYKKTERKNNKKNRWTKNEKHAKMGNDGVEFGSQAIQKLKREKKKKREKINFGKTNLLEEKLILCNFPWTQWKSSLWLLWTELLVQLLATGARTRSRLNGAECRWESAHNAHRCATSSGNKWKFTRLKPHTHRTTARACSLPQPHI